MSVVQGILSGSSARSAKGAGSGTGAKGAGSGTGANGTTGGKSVNGIGNTAGGTGAGADHTAGRRTAARVLRPARTPAAVVVAAAIALLGWALTAAVVAALLGVAHWRLPPRLSHVTLADPAVAVAAVGMILCGAGLVALALVPGRPRLMPLHCRDPLLAMGLTRAGLRRTLAASAREVEHVRRAGVHILRRRIEVIVVADANTTGALLREVGAAVGDRLSGLGVQSRHEVVVRLRGRGV
ncbi:DUF6286 domain-containing protein [Microbispora sp. NPDC088329]|uniref:DUF6286 domain-containing protein n=1 Tax=Microbispora sp. NPDC088329 TaxID=3154869 RepID=UPI0034358511